MKMLRINQSGRTSLKLVLLIVGVAVSQTTFGSERPKDFPDLQAGLNGIISVIEEKNSAIRDLQERLRQNEYSVSAMKKKIVDVQSMLDETKKDWSEKKEQIKTLEKDKEELNDQMSSLGQKSSEEKEELKRDYESNKARLEASRQELEARINALKEEGDRKNKELAVEKAGLARQYDEATQTVSALKEKIDTQKQEKDSLNMQLDEARVLFEKNTQAIADLKIKQAEAAEAHARDLKKEIADVENQYVNHAATVNEAHKNAILEMKEKLEGAQREKNTEVLKLTQEFEAEKSILKQTKETEDQQLRSDFESRFAEVSRLNSGLEDKIKNLELLEKASQMALTKNKAAIEDLMHQMEGRTKEIEALTVKNSGLAKELTTQIDAAKGEQSKLESRVAELEHELEKAKAYVNSIEEQMKAVGSEAASS